MKEILESLQEYATDPLVGEPPEILPQNSADPWGLDGAARSALGLLVAGEKPGEQLYAVADYLLSFCTPYDRSKNFPDALLLSGTALALCGYLCEGAHPEAELWRMTGCARLATEVHNRKAALENRVSAACLLAVCRIADEMELPILADLITLRERMWGRLLDHSRAERLHVSEADYPSHMVAPVAPEQVGEVMLNRDWQWQARMPLGCDPVYMSGPDLKEAEETCDNLLTLHAHMLVRHQFGSDIDWHLRLFNDVESTVGLNWHGLIRNLAGAYAETGDEKFALHAARLLRSFYRLSPIPNHRQGTGPWRTLEVVGRQSHTWPDTISYLGQTAAFDEATHAMLARSRLEHMRYLLAYCGGAGNWYQLESAGRSSPIFS